MLEKVKQEFVKHFGSLPQIYCSPGRVNLIGDHTDYNLGFVLPGAIDKAIYLAILPTSHAAVRVWSIDFESSVEFGIDGEQPSQMWASYIYGMVQEMRKRGAEIGGFDCVVGGNVPLGAGLSSSAALEGVVGYALNDIYNCGLTLQQLAECGQMTEHNYIGVRCGIMDQFASLFGKKDLLIKLDCRDLSYEYTPFDPDGYRVMLIDSMVKHSLASSEYNIRREQCEAAVSVISKHIQGIKSLRDVSLEMLEKYRSEIDPVSYKRSLFVLNENSRVAAASQSLTKGDYQQFGRQMFLSHEGLSKQYEVSCAELDFLVDKARESEYVAGARMMGGGFGGCVIHLVNEQEHDRYLYETTNSFEKQFNIKPRVIDVIISDGARRLE